MSPAETAAAVQRDPLHRYLLAWMVGGALTAGLVLVVADLLAPSTAGWIVLSPLLAVALVTAGEVTELRLDHGKAAEVITLLEAAVVVALVATTPDVAVLATTGGIAVAQVLRRRPLRKVAFNVAQYGAAAAAAAGVFALLGGYTAGPGTSWALAAGVAMVAFGAVNTLAITGIVALLEQRPMGEVYRQELPLSLLIVLGNSSVGLVAVLLWTTWPTLTFLVLFPLGALHMAYRGVVHSRQLLEQVRAERDRLGSILASAYDGIVSFDAQGRVEVWSAALATITGLATEEAIGREVDAVLSTRGVGEDTPVRLYADLASAAPTGVRELELITDQGVRVVRAEHHAVINDRGTRTGTVFLLHDVTRERETDRLKDDFISRVSHELRTPLTPIKGFAHILTDPRREMNDEMRSHVLGRIEERADDMVRLIDDLLLVATLQEDQLGVLVEPVRVDDVVSGVVERFRAEEGARRFVIEAATSANAAADTARVEQILGHLMDNAVKFSSADDEIVVRVDHDADGRLTLAVRDHGRGIPRDHLGRVFDRFHRVEDPLVMETGGLGLGLFISRRLAERMGGTLTVESELGEGSTFTLTLPAVAGLARVV